MLYLSALQQLCGIVAVSLEQLFCAKHAAEFPVPTRFILCGMLFSTFASVAWAAGSREVRFAGEVGASRVSIVFFLANLIAGLMHHEWHGLEKPGLPLAVQNTIFLASISIRSVCISFFFDFSFRLALLMAGLGIVFTVSWNPACGLPLNDLFEIISHLKDNNEPVFVHRIASEAAIGLVFLFCLMQVPPCTSVKTHRPGWLGRWMAWRLMAA